MTERNQGTERRSLLAFVAMTLIGMAAGASRPAR